MAQEERKTEERTSWLARAGLLLLALIGALYLLAWLLASGRLSLTGTEPPVSAADPAVLARPGLVELAVDGVALAGAPSLDPPVLVELDGYRFDVAAAAVGEAQLWQALELPANQVGWLENSIVNYVFRLPAGRGYRALLQEAAGQAETAAGAVASPGTEKVVTLTTSSGNRHTFAIAPGSGQPLTPSTPVVGQTEPALTLLWVDEADPAAGYVLRAAYRAEPEALQALRIQGQGSAAEPAGGAPALAVRLEAIDVQADGLQLLVRGSLTNKGTEPRFVEAGDIRLVAGGLQSQVLAADPPLPWEVPAGNRQIFFSVTLQRPLEEEAVLTIGTQPFALELR